MARTTRELMLAQDQGAVIRVFDPDSEHRGKQVSYDPEKARDFTPWRLTRGEARFQAWQCRAEGMHGGPWVLASLLRLPNGRG